MQIVGEQGPSLNPLNEKLIATKRGQALFMQRSIAISFAKK